MLCFLNQCSLEQKIKKTGNLNLKYHTSGSGHSKTKSLLYAYNTTDGKNRYFPWLLATKWSRKLLKDKDYKVVETHSNKVEILTCVASNCVGN